MHSIRHLNIEPSTQELDVLIAELQAAYPLLNKTELLTLALRGLHSLSTKTHDHSSVPNFSPQELADEMWQPLRDFQGCEVSNLGRIRGGVYNAQRIRKISRQTGGYAVLRLQAVTGPVQVQVSRLVAEAFLRPPQNGEVLNHLNGNKLDNRATNLEWTWQKQNVHHSNQSGLRKRTSRAMSGMTGAKKEEIYRFQGRVTQSLLAKIYGLKSSEIAIIRRQFVNNLKS